ncbi:hypothetical protein TcasGA2_TC007391 [Tribolium castaneum]|uniref:Uncharacterized protein n=1 Tax=Tribolium castaneum TaxID=7070 RepID=D1ZZV5_TRICA|nr:hypothetical protein TcasGA2_TC007391 [Tribolium castaneum]
MSMTTWFKSNLVRSLVAVVSGDSIILLTFYLNIKMTGKCERDVRSLQSHEQQRTFLLTECSDGYLADSPTITVWLGPAKQQEFTMHSACDLRKKQIFGVICQEELKQRKHRAFAHGYAVRQHLAWKTRAGVNRAVGCYDILGEGVANRTVNINKLSNNTLAVVQDA